MLLSVEGSQGRGWGPPRATAVESFEEPLKKTLSNMKQLSEYRFWIHPVTKAIAEAIDDNEHILLKELFMFVDYNITNNNLLLSNHQNSLKI